MQLAEAHADLFRVWQLAPARPASGAFAGSNIAIGLGAGFALIYARGLLVVRKREVELQKALDHQTSALQKLTRR